MSLGVDVKLRDVYTYVPTNLQMPWKINLFGKIIENKNQFNRKNYNILDICSNIQ